jgi:hypothetical protein
VFWDYRLMANGNVLDQIDAQERAVQRFAQASPEETVALAAELAATMRVVVEDDELWNGLAEASRRPGDAGELRQLVLVDWEALLGQWGVPDGEIVAMELIEAVAEADGEGDWREARELLRELTELLEGDTQEPQPQQAGWLRRVRERAAAGFSALRRVKTGVIAEGGMGMAEATVPALLGAAFVPLVGPAAPLAGAAVGGLGIGLVRHLRETLAERAPSGLDVLFDARALRPEANGAARADLDVLKVMGENARWGSPIADLLVNVRLWAARIGATLAVARPFVAAHLRDAGLFAVDRVMMALLDFQHSLRRIAAAANDKDGDLFAAGIDRAHEVAERIGDSLWGLQGLVAHR